MAKKPKDDEYKTYYEQGEQAAWRGESADAMPNFRRGLRASAWQKGHADGLFKKQLQQDKDAVSRPGLAKMRAIIASAVGEG